MQFLEGNLMAMGRSHRTESLYCHWTEYNEFMSLTPDQCKKNPQISQRKNSQRQKNFKHFKRNPILHWNKSLYCTRINNLEQV